MCSGGSPEPDINKPSFTPDQIDKNIKVTATDKKGNNLTSDAAQLAKVTYGDGPVPIQSSGLRMNGGR